MNKYIFFLGGHDAEMVEIRNILEAHRLSCFDKRLSWGASLSAYKDDIAGLPTDAIPVLIELKPDMPLPVNAMIIDHHDEKAGKDKQTSIEQIAELLDIELSRKQKLISANDKGHIRGMKKICATDEEIAEIRALDRKAQGVTEEDEKLAEESVEKRLEQITDNAAIVNSLTNKTSPVFDRLYDKYKHVFVFTPDGEMNYSGTGEVVCRLISIYKEKQKNNQSIEFWYGGNMPDYGFFGTKFSLLQEEIISIFVKGKSNSIISQHIFMFPFRITLGEEKKAGGKITNHPKCREIDNLDNNKDNENEINICNVFYSLIDGGWEYIPYKVDTPAHYGEYYYFHEYVRDAIFESRPRKRIEELFLENKLPDVISYYFERNVAADSILRIHIKRKNNGKIICSTYDLTIHHLSLRLFSTDIGILAIELYDYNDKLDLQDIMYINEYGRRIYPQFLPDNCDIDEVKNAFLADSIEFKCGDIKSTEDFCPITKYLERKLVVADYIKKLLGESFLNIFEFIPIIDDRMFTVCWYANAELIKELQQEVGFTGKNSYETSDKWYSFAFIDGSVSGVSAGGRIKEDLIKQFTYPRWIHQGTLFGVTRYSLMCLTHGKDTFTSTILRNHMERMYYQMAIILLAQRASILKFSDDVSKISGKIECIKAEYDRKEFAKIAEDVKNLHSSFIHFVNRLWYTEVTPQEQGIEMYNMAVKNMGLKEQLDEVRQEIKELYEFVNMQYEKMQMQDDRKINKTLSRLNWLVVIFLPITVVSGLLGMNIYDANDIPKIINEFLNIDIRSSRVFYQRLFIFIIPTMFIYFIIFGWFLCQKVYIKLLKKE